MRKGKEIESERINRKSQIFLDKRSGIGVGLIPGIFFMEPLSSDYSPHGSSPFKSGKIR